MKEKKLKLISCLLCFAIFLSFSFVFAGAVGHVDEKTVIKNIANRVLDIVMWFAYALAFGSLIFFGIKYMLSTADEKANLKGMLPKYLIGMVAILFCFTIASFVAGIAGNNPAEEIIGVGEQAGEQFTGTTQGVGVNDEDDDGKDEANDNLEDNRNIGG